MSWMLPRPFILPLQVQATHIDHYGHVNNAAYLTYMEEASWRHSEQLGLGFADYQRLDRAMVVARHEIDYLQPAYEGDALEIATWIVECDRKMRLVRRFQLLRPADGKTLLKARTLFVCAGLADGRPRRFPEEFVATYLPAVVAEQTA